MAQDELIVILAVTLAFCSGLCLVFYLKDLVARMVSMTRVRNSALGEVSALGVLLRSGVSWARPLARPLLRLPRIARVCDSAVQLLQGRGLVTNAEGVASVWFAGLVILFLGGSLVGSSVLVGLALAIGASIILSYALERQAEHDTDQIREAVPNALRSMETCFRAGLSLEQTFEQLANEFEGSLGEVFRRTSQELKVGVSAHQALSKMGVSQNISELAFVSVALSVQHDTGGSMHRVLAAARDSIERDLKTRRSLKVKTAQAKLSAQVVTAMPFVLVIVLSFLTEDFLAPFFSSALGLVLFFAALVMQGAGVLIVRRMLAVKVG